METKSVIVVTAALPLGLAANAVAVLGVALGSAVPGLIGAAVTDSDGLSHPGVVRAPLPVLQQVPGEMLELFRRAAADGSVFTTAFSGLAQRSRSYEEYTHQLASTGTMDLDLIGVALHGPRKRVDRLTGALPLLR